MKTSKESIPNNNADNNGRPIGIFDSGLGGLTVLGPLMENLPAESTVYLGDLAHTPYGNRTNQEIREFAVAGLHFLSNFNIKALIVACNSASAVALPDLLRQATFPIFDVVSPGARMAALHSKSRSIGVVGTTATIQSGAYALELKTIDVNLQIFQTDCPELAPMIEMGTKDIGDYLKVIKKCLARLPMREIDTLILGCTHYPLVRDVFRAVCGEEVRLIDSGLATAEAIEEALRKTGELVSDPLTNMTQSPDSQVEPISGTRQYFVTSTKVMDHMKSFQEMAQQFLGLDSIFVQEANITNNDDNSSLTETGSKKSGVTS